jgi:hypothetical protein
MIIDWSSPASVLSSESAAAADSLIRSTAPASRINSFCEISLRDRSSWPPSLVDAPADVMRAADPAPVTAASVVRSSIVVTTPLL